MTKQTVQSAYGSTDGKEAQKAGGGVFQIL